MKKRYHLIAWLSLVLPTLAIAVIAFVLLAREQERLDALLRESALMQLQTTADNIDLAMGEIKTGTMQALQAASGPGDELARLQELTSTNPFIHAYLIWAPGALPLSGNKDDLSPASATGQDRWKEFLPPAQPPPWLLPRAQRSPGMRRAAARAGADAADVSHHGSFRRQTRAKFNRQDIRDISHRSIEALNVLKEKEAHLQTRDTRPERPLPSSQGRASEARSKRLGWMERNDDAPGWLGWFQYAPGHLTGVILDPQAVLSQLSGSFPEDDDAGLRLLAPDGQSFPPTAKSGETADAYALPVGAEMPGWHVLMQPPSTAGNRGFFLLGGLLIATLCAATLGAGTLLLLQARRDAKDATRKTTFVANVSHELRTPLTTIRMYAEMLDSGRVTDPDKRSHYLNTITTEALRLNRLVDNVLDFSRLEQGHKTYRREPVDVARLVTTVLESQAPQLNATNMQVQWQPPATALTIQTDPDALGQVLLNLIDNAIKYATDGRLLHLSLRACPNEVELSVEDHGGGIASADRQRAFKAFQRLDENLTASTPGTGLGLSICKSILNDLGGKIELHRASSGGCRFLITLPFARP